MGFMENRQALIQHSQNIQDGLNNIGRAIRKLAFNILFASLLLVGGLVLIALALS